MRTTWARQVMGIAVAALGVVVLSGIARAQATDPFVGTWRLDVAKSTFKPGPPPKSVTVTIAAAGKGIKVVVDSVSADGPLKWEYTSARDGKDVPVTGNPGYDAANVTQATPQDTTIVYKMGGKPVVTAKAALSKDGKMMTVNYTGTDAKGQAIASVLQFVKS
jgi:hypothetical protein